MIAGSSRLPQSLWTCARELVEHVAFTLACHELFFPVGEVCMARKASNAASITEYRVEVDGRFYFDPFLMPTSEDYTGLKYTRVFRLPFVPYNGLRWENAITSSRSCWGCNVMELEEVVWCSDRHMFTASTKPLIWSCLHTHNGVLQAVAELLEAGWISTCDDYGGASAPECGGYLKRSAQNKKASWSTILKWKDKPTVLQNDSDICRELRQALVRLTFWVGDGSIAYALDHTGLLLGDVPQDAQNDAQWRRWVKARQAYYRLSPKRFWRWKRKVLKEYPRLIDLVLRCQRQIDGQTD